ncbi:MAG: nucleotidyltransferase domain-containing protein [Pseudonocardiaceae bacterium]
MGAVIADEQRVADVLRCAGARFGLVHGSRARGSARPDSDLDVGAWWGDRPPASWEVDLPVGVDLVVLDTAPLWLSGRIAQQGRLLFDDDPRARVRWQADTRLRYLDEIPAIRERYRRRRIELAGRAPRG